MKSYGESKISNSRVRSWNAFSPLGSSYGHVSWRNSCLRYSAYRQMEKRLIHEIPPETNRTIHPRHLYKNVDNASLLARPLPHFIESGSTRIWHGGLVDARRGQKWKMASFSARRGWQRGDQFLKESGMSQSLSLFYSFFRFLSTCVERA